MLCFNQTTGFKRWHTSPNSLSMVSIRILDILHFISSNNGQISEQKQYHRDFLNKIGISSSLDTAALLSQTQPSNPKYHPRIKIKPECMLDEEECIYSCVCCLLSGYWIRLGWCSNLYSCSWFAFSHSTGNMISIIPWTSRGLPSN